MTTRKTYGERGKLIRRKLPNLIRQRGNVPGIRETYGKENVAILLMDKLKEEVGELLDAKADDDIIEEACDVMTVLLDYIHLKGFTKEELETVIQAKLIKRGNFFYQTRHGDIKAIVLEHVDNQ